MADIIKVFVSHEKFTFRLLAKSYFLICKYLFVTIIIF